jgi:hypothetical protein
MMDQITSGGTIMTKSDLMGAYRRMSADDHVTYQRWLTTNSVIASAFVAALVAIIVFEPTAIGKSPEAQNAQSGGLTVAAK